MKVLHVLAKDICGPTITASVEMCLLSVTGVARVAVVSSVGLVSVLFDETKASALDIVESLKHIGVDARVLRPGVAQPAI